MRKTRLTDPAPLRIETENEWAWCGDRRLDLTPRAFAVLQHLVSHPARLVTKTELLDVVWHDTIVSEAALASCIRDLRKALRDSSRSPRYLETVHRRGFRFIGPLGGTGAARSLRPAISEVAALPRRQAPHVVGRAAEIERLDELFAEALAGRRRVVFVSGEPGIGKTTLVETFLARIDGHDGVRVGRGQCVEHYGAGEPYLPLLEALGRMGRDPGGEALVATLRRFAPTWLAQLPALLEDHDLDAVQRRAQGSTRERMLRELAEALDALCVDRPLVLLLEDLHWSDSATIDLLAMVARRGDAARLMVLGTYRPADVVAGGHALNPVRRELRLHGRCEDLALDFLSESAVAEYLATRLPGAAIPTRLVPALHRSTTGNPLFLATLVDDLVARGRVRESEGRWQFAEPPDDVAASIPHTLAQLVERQIDRLTPEQQAVLEVASVAGADFSAALPGCGGIDPQQAERSCAELAIRGHFVRPAGVAEWPDGTVAGRYAFIHALHRNVLYGRIPGARRVGLHLRVGARLEQAHGARAGEVAGELAMHFAEGRDFERAVKYRRLAADNSLRHYAHREAASHATRALEMLAAFPESPERLLQELAIGTTLCAALIALGSAGSEVVSAYGRVRELCARLGTRPEILPALIALCRYHTIRGEPRIAGELAKELATLADATGNLTVRLAACNGLGVAAFHAGDFPAALEELERGLAAYDPERHSGGRAPALWGGHDAGVSCGVHSAWALWLLGHPDRAATRMREAIDRARSAGYPFILANACAFAATFHACRGEPDAVREASDVATEESAEHGFETVLGAGAIHRGWLLSAGGEGDEAVAQIRSGYDAYRETGAGVGAPTFLGFLAAACATCGRVEEGLAAVAEARAVADSTGSHYWDAELSRLRGTLLLSGSSATRRPSVRRASAPPQHEAEAESCFTSALATARRQGARMLELRAAVDVARLWRDRGRATEAHALLSDVYGGFAEGFETADLTEARRLLEQTGGTRRRS